MVKKVLITGGALSGNEGAAAMTISTLQFVRDIAPDAKVSMISSRPSDVLRGKKFKVKVIQEITDIRIRQLIGLYFLSKMFPGYAKNYLLRHTNKYISAINDSDLILDVTGDTLSEDYGFKLCSFYLARFFYPIMLGKKYIILPQSLGPFNHPILKYMFKEVIQNACSVNIREKRTEEHLKAMSITNYSLLPDMGFFLNKSDKPALRLKGKKYLGLSISNLIARFSNGSMTRDKYVELNLDFIKHILKNTDYEIILITHVKDSHVDDRKIAKEIYEKINNKRVIYFKDDFDATELKEIISHCRIFIGARMHANIAALSQGIPTISVAYSHKFHGIMGGLGQDRFVIDFKNLTLEGLKKLFKEVEKEHGSIQKELKKKNREIQSKGEIIKNEIIKPYLAVK